MASLLGCSLKAVHSYDQGWRNIPPHVERYLLYLVSCGLKDRTDGKPCWELIECPQEWRDHCIAWELKEGTLCWFINGAYCRGRTRQGWDKKMAECRTCAMMEKVVREMERTDAG